VRNRRYSETVVFRRRGVPALALVALLVSGCAGQQAGAEKLSAAPLDRSAAAAGKLPAAASEKVEKGDLVRVGYTITLEDGSLVETTVSDTPHGTGPAGGAPVDGRKALGDVDVLAGEKGTAPGVGEGVVGMVLGGKKRLELAPDKAYGTYDAGKVRQLPRDNAIPLTITVPAREYVDKFNSFPVAGREFPLNPYVMARIAEVREADVRLEMLAKDGSRYEEGFGSVAVNVGKDAIHLRIDPRQGASFDIQGVPGRITATDEATFTVDCNHPLAGKKVVVDMEVRSLVKSASFKDTEIGWRENHDEGLAAAKEAGKPAVLVLYAEWCGWCKKLFGETLHDPRITQLKDAFAWVKVNSNQETGYKARYGQDGFPMIVIINPDGTVYRKIEGFRDGATLSREFREYLAMTDGHASP